MNAFYERLKKFGALIQAEAQQSGNPVEQHFSLVHPGYPVVSRARSITPHLEFEDTCPVHERRKIRKLFRKAFSSQQAAL